MADLKDFDVIRVARSDGADTGPGYWPVTAPTPTLPKKAAKDMAPEKTPRSKPQMIRLAEDDPRFVEWRVKLGILLKQELSPTPDGNGWLVNFPRGYWLYEKSKHLWVSGYPVKGKLFKSPQEFALHLIWLLTASMDYRDCCCVHCNTPGSVKAMQIVDDSPAIFHEAPKVEKIPPKVTPVPLPAIPGHAPPKQQTPVPIPSPVQHVPAATGPRPPVPTTAAPPSQALAQQPQLQPRPQPQPSPQQQVQPHVQPQVQPQAQPQTQPQTQPQQKPQTQPQLLPQTQTQGQAQVQTQPVTQTSLWSIKSSLLFRTGELVWYQNGSTWRLGMIAAAFTTNYEVMPIGHGIAQAKNVSKSNGDMRPFYAFTVPPVTRPDLKDKSFDEIPWEAMFQSPGLDGNQREMLILDASKMAASKIDYSYSLWTPYPEDPNGKTATYYGCFFGAERIEIGDALRLKASPSDVNVQADRLVFGLRFIFTSKDVPGSVFFRGHIYQAITGTGNHPNIVPDENLPIALRDESNWRNSVSPNQGWRWAIVKENSVLKEPSIKGRFYPTHRLMPIMNPGSFQKAVASGQADQQYAHLNNRMDGSGRYLGRKRNRLDSLGTAVPHTARFGFEGHVREEAFDQAMVE